MQCPRCGCDYALPVEPLYSIESVCLLVPVKRAQLRSWIGRNRGVLSPAKYTGPSTRSRRLFTAGDVRLLRAALVRSTPVPVRSPVPSPQVYSGAQDGA